MGRAALSLLLCATALCATLHPASCTDSGMCTSPEVPCGAPEAAPACAAPTAGSNGSEACAAPVVEQPSASASDTPPPCPKLVDYPGGRAAIDISTMDPVTECDRQLLTEVLAFDEGRQAAGVAEEGAPAAPPTDATASEPIDPAVARENARADVAMGAVFLERGEVEPALELFRRATSTDPARMSAWTYIARVLVGLPTPDLASAKHAVDTVQRLLDSQSGSELLDGEGSEAAVEQVRWQHQDVASILARKESESQALADPIQPSTPNTDSHDPFGRQLMFASAHEANTVGIATAEAGQVEESLAIFELAVEMSPGVSTYHSNLAVSYMRLKRWDDARAAVEEALRLNPADATALRNLQELNYYTKPVVLVGDSSLVTNILEDPKPADGSGSGGSGGSSSSGSSSEGEDGSDLPPVDETQEFVSGQQACDEAFKMLAAGERERAMSLFRTAIKMDPSRADYLMNLGITYMMDKDYKSARVAFQVALNIQPGHSCTIKNLVELDEKERVPILGLPDPEDPYAGKEDGSEDGSEEDEEDRYDGPPLTSEDLPGYVPPDFGEPVVVLSSESTQGGSCGADDGGAEGQCSSGSAQ